MSTPKSGDEEAKKGRMGRYMIEGNNAVQERVHLHPTCVPGKCYTLFADGEENQRL